MISLEILHEMIIKECENPNLGVEYLADKCNMSISTFYRFIKQNTNKSPLEFIENIRLTNAIILCETSNYSVKEIAYSVGYNDPHYFTKCFKQKYSVTPSLYKKQLKNSVLQ